MSYGEALTSWTSDRQHLPLAASKHHQWGRVIGLNCRFNEAAQRIYLMLSFISALAQVQFT